MSKKKKESDDNLIGLDGKVDAHGLVAKVKELESWLVDNDNVVGNLEDLVDRITRTSVVAAALEKLERMEGEAKESEVEE